MDRKIIIGSRGSQLALWQAHYVESLLTEQGYEVEIEIIKTQGDKIQNVGFDKLEGKGFFTKELEESLLDESIDIAVHSYKDLPTENPEGLIIAGNSYRDRTEDWLIINKKAVHIGRLWDLKEGAIVGTSSPRRVAQLLAFRPDIKVVPIRGNVPTRVKKVEEEVDAVVLAAAGLSRLELDLSNYHLFKFDPRKFIPAAVQGVLAYQIKEGNAKAAAAIETIHDSSAEAAVKVERSILHQLEGGCQLPIGVYCEYEEERYNVWAFYQSDYDVNKPKAKAYKRLFRSSRKPEKVVKKTLKALKAFEPQKVFISRNQSGKSYFKKQLESQGYLVEGNSLINFKVAEVFELPEADWIFFSSRKGVQYFFEIVPRFNGVQRLLMYKIACLGSGTANELKEYGFQPDFIGNDEGVEDTAQTFLKIAEGQDILFPQASNSKQSIQKRIGENINAINWVVYENEPIQDFPELDHDILAFTSSLNAEAYLSKHEIKEHQRILAIGTSTAETLKNLGIEKVEIAWQASEIGLVDII